MLNPEGWSEALFFQMFPDSPKKIRDQGNKVAEGFGPRAPFDVESIQTFAAEVIPRFRRASPR